MMNNNCHYSWSEANPAYSDNAAVFPATYILVAVVRAGAATPTRAERRDCYIFVQPVVPVEGAVMQEYEGGTSRDEILQLDASPAIPMLPGTWASWSPCSQAYRC